MSCISVCRDMELRVSSDSDGYTTAEVCIDDIWHTINSAVNLNDHPPRNIEVDIDTALLKIKWQSPSGIAPVEQYDTFCTTITTVTDSGQHQMIKVENLSPDVRVADINLPLQSATYNCCVTAYIRQSSLQLVTTSTACASISVSAGNPCISSPYTIGFGSALGFVVLLLPIACLVCLCIVLSCKTKCQAQPSRWVTYNNNSRTHSKGTCMALNSVITTTILMSCLIRLAGPGSWIRSCQYGMQLCTFTTQHVLWYYRNLKWY